MSEPITRFELYATPKGERFIIGNTDTGGVIIPVNREEPAKRLVEFINGLLDARE